MGKSKRLDAVGTSGKLVTTDMLAGLLKGDFPQLVENLPHQACGGAGREVQKPQSPQMRRVNHLSSAQQ